MLDVPANLPSTYISALAGRVVNDMLAAEAAAVAAAFRCAFRTFFIVVGDDADAGSVAVAGVGAVGAGVAT